MKLTLKVEEKDYDQREGKVEFSVTSDASNETVYINVGVECEYRNIKFTFSEASGPTYVPYGETSVLYDKGDPELEEVDASEAVVAEHEDTFDDTDVSITDVKACELLKCNLATFHKCIEDAEEMAADFMKDHVEDYYINHPEEAEMPDPSDYDE